MERFYESFETFIHMNSKLIHLKENRIDESTKYGIKQNSVVFAHDKTI